MPNAIRIRPQSADDDARVLEIDNAIFDTHPPTTLDEYRYRLSTLPADIHRAAVVAERDGTILGHAVWNRSIVLADRTAFHLTITVDPPAQCQGIGSALYETAIEDLYRLGARRVYGYVREDHPQARAFLDLRGFRELEQGGDRPSRLNVRKAMLDAARAAEKRMDESGIRITNLDQLGTDDRTLREIWELECRTARDMPSVVAWEGLPFDFWCDVAIRAPKAALDAFLIAVDGDRPVGLATVQPRSGNTAENGYTAVDAAYRGRGIARALKLHAVEWARGHGVTHLYTRNHAGNVPMIRINDELGYEPLPASIEVVKELEGES